MKKMFLSKQVRYDIFKDNHFTCPCCGQKVPDVVLKAVKETDEEGNTTGISVLCYDCDISEDNTGKDLTEEKNEQIEMFFTWKKSLQKSTDRSASLLVDYINEKMEPLTVTDRWVRLNANKLLKKYKLELLLEAIDKSAETYIEYDSEGNVIKESAEKYISKIYGVANNLMMPETERQLTYKIHYIKKICKNRFTYFDDRKGFVIINELIKALRESGNTDEEIINILDTAVVNFSKDCQNWTQWREQMNAWITAEREKHNAESEE